MSHQITNNSRRGFKRIATAAVVFAGLCFVLPSGVSAAVDANQAGTCSKDSSNPNKYTNCCMQLGARDYLKTTNCCNQAKLWKVAKTCNDFAYNYRTGANFQKQTGTVPTLAAGPDITAAESAQAQSEEDVIVGSSTTKNSNAESGKSQDSTAENNKNAATVVDGAADCMEFSSSPSKFTNCCMLFGNRDYLLTTNCCNQATNTKVINACNDLAFDFRTGDDALNKKAPIPTLAVSNDEVKGGNSTSSAGGLSTLVLTLIIGGGIYLLSMVASVGILVKSANRTPPNVALFKGE